MEAKVGSPYNFHRMILSFKQKHWQFTHVDNRWNSFIKLYHVPIYPHISSSPVQMQLNSSHPGLHWHHTLCPVKSKRPRTPNWCQEMQQGTRKIKIKWRSCERKTSKKKVPTHGALQIHLLDPEQQIWLAPLQWIRQVKTKNFSSPMST